MVIVNPSVLTCPTMLAKTEKVLFTLLDLTLEVVMYLLILPNHFFIRYHVLCDFVSPLGVCRLVAVHDLEQSADRLGLLHHFSIS